MAKREKLSANVIVQAATKMIDESGAEQFSMRRLAARLHVDPMAIYHHHANKGALIHAVLTEVMDEFRPPMPSDDWQGDLRALSAELRTLAHRHPGCFRLYELYEDWVIGELRMKEAFHRTLLSAGFTRKAAVRATRLLVAYTEAYAVDEIDGWLDVDDRGELTEMLATGPFPVTMDLVGEIAEPDHEADFAFGLDVLIEGLSAAQKRENQAP